MAKEYRFDIAILRLIAIAIVVFFHAYGMTYAKAHLPADISAMYRDKYEMFNQSYLINIAMPLFTVISGFLFGGQLMHNKYGSFWAMTFNKFKRLMIPYFVFTVFFMFATNNLSVEPFYKWSYWHLWYLPMLFWCFIICYSIKKVLFIRGGEFALLILAFALSLLIDKLPSIVGIAQLPNFLCWFMLGIVICRYEKRMFDIIAKYHLVWAMIAIYTVLSIYFPAKYGTETLAGECASLLAVLALWYISHLIPWQKFRITHLLMIVSSCSFGIYIFHNWIEVYMISSTAQRLFPIAAFAKAHIWLFPFLFSSAAFVISFVISWLLRKTRVGRFLIG